MLLLHIPFTFDLGLLSVTGDLSLLSDDMLEDEVTLDISTNSNTYKLPKGVNNSSG